jgi:hypothetical protein
VFISGGKRVLGPVLGLQSIATAIGTPKRLRAAHAA